MWSILFSAFYFRYFHPSCKRTPCLFAVQWNANKCLLATFETLGHGGQSRWTSKVTFSLNASFLHTMDVSCNNSHAEWAWCLSLSLHWDLDGVHYHQEAVVRCVIYLFLGGFFFRWEGGGGLPAWWRYQPAPEAFNREVFVWFVLANLTLCINQATTFWITSFVSVHF